MTTMSKFYRYIFSCLTYFPFKVTPEKAIYEEPFDGGKGKVRKACDLARKS